MPPDSIVYLVLLVGGIFGALLGSAVTILFNKLDGIKGEM